MPFVPKSISLLEGTLGISSGRTSRNSLTIGTDKRKGTSTLESLTLTKLSIHMLETNFLALRYEMKRPLDIVELLAHSMTGSFRLWNLTTQKLQSIDA